MCTVSFIARPQGYALAMNRDEQRSRALGLPPQSRQVSGRLVLCPSEPGGGTWISLNEAGVAYALINWYSVPQKLTGNLISRGEIVNAVSDKVSVESAERRIEMLPLAHIKPFRLIGFFPGSEEVVQWQWDLKRLKRIMHDWCPQQWISSGFDEPQAQRVRGQTFETALRQEAAGTLDWLRQLHRSHLPEAGPFSTCMHREDAATVSLTEIEVHGNEGTLLYHPGSPCECRQTSRFLCRMPLRPDGLALLHPSV